MSEYKKIKTPKGERWLKGNKLVSAKDVPDEVKKYYSETSTTTTTVPQRRCIFCGMFGECEKRVSPSPDDVRIIYLCQDHYLEKTTGEVVEQIRKKDNKEAK